MANYLTPVDVYPLFNDIVAQATGRDDLKAVNTTTFQSVGELLLRNSTENVLNAISTVISKTIFSVRPYKAKLSTLQVAQDRWGAQVRKIVTLYDEAEQSEDHTTNIEYNNFADGNTIDMYKVRKPKVLQLNFYGTKVLQKHITRFRDQLSIAFTSEAEFMQFIDAIMVEFFNEVELLNEAKTRTTLISYMAGIANMGGAQVVDLLAEFNKKYNTTYTRDQVLGEHVSQFMKFVASQIKIYSKRLTDMSVNYHSSIDGYPKIMRHTPKEKQKMVMYDPIFIEAESEVYSSLFNPEYLNIGDFEGVNYWQNQNAPTEISVKPNILDTNTGNSIDGKQTTISYALGILFDEEAMGVVPQFDYTSVTPFNSAGGYYNMFMHWRFNSYADYTENAILFIIGDGTPADPYLKNPISYDIEPEAMQLSQVSTSDVNSLRLTSFQGDQGLEERFMNKKLDLWGNPVLSTAEGYILNDKTGQYISNYGPNTIPEAVQDAKECTYYTIPNSVLEGWEDLGYPSEGYLYLAVQEAIELYRNTYEAQGIKPEKIRILFTRSGEEGVLEVHAYVKE